MPPAPRTWPSFVAIIVVLVTLVAGDATGTPVAPPWVSHAAQDPTAWDRGGGPVLVLTGTDNGFTRYLPEVLGSEGLGGEFVEGDAADLGAGLDLGRYDRIVLGDTVVTSAGVRALTDWTRGGGTLVAMRPADNLAPLFGLSRPAGTLSDGYLRVTEPDLATATYPGTMQYHGSAATRTALAGTREIAVLYEESAVATPYPAISARDVGDRGGQAIAFAYDLARSVVYTRQGNPVWAAQDRDSELDADGLPLCEPTDCLKRSDDLFAGTTSAGSSTWTGNWVDLTRNQVPQADLQQRVLVDLLEDAAPLPRLWYLPTYQPAPGGLLKAAVVLTGDDHNQDSQTVRRFTAERDDPRQPAGCGQDGTPVSPAVVAAWRCVRSTSYAYGATTTDAVALGWDRLGFEIAPHVSDGGDCPSDWTSPAQFDGRIFGPDIRRWAAWYRSATAAFPPLTERVHCVQWNNWSGTPRVEARYGITLDTNYYQWPQELFGANPGLMTGSGLPQRFAGTTGRPLPVWQATTQITDETPGTNMPGFIRELLQNATGPNAWYGVFTANEHLDNLPESNRAASDLTSAALAAGVPVISARQLAEWELARSASTQTMPTASGFAESSAAGGGPTQRWRLNDAPAHAMEMIPAGWGSLTLRALTVNGRARPLRVQVVNGIRYALVGDAPSGDYTASYA